MTHSRRKSPVDPSFLSLATKAIHGRKLRPFRGPVAPAIYQTSTYRFADSNDAVRYAQGDPDVYVYTRYHNPTVAEAEERLSLMLETERALLVASGMAAISSAILSVAHAGDEIISTPALYGGTYRFFRDILPELNIRVRYVNPNRLTRIVDLANPRTRAIYFETPTNPTLGIVDIDALISATRAAERRVGHKIITMIDNTFATALNQNPHARGVDVVLESGTKYLGGHSDLLAGVVASTEKFVRGAHTQMKYFGGCIDPFAAFLMLRSLKTFELRVQRQNETASALAYFLKTHPNVRAVLYPGLASHPGHAIARKQMVEAGGMGYGGMVTIEVRGGVRGSVKVCDALRVAVNAMSLGGAETLVSIPVYSSHIGMTSRELASHGVTPGMIRISVGLEGFEDLKDDFARALDLLS
jgi:cystathionine beta-lyase/cystathionine gamma-synthase